MISASYYDVTAVCWDRARGVYCGVTDCSRIIGKPRRVHEGRPPRIAHTCEICIRPRQCEPDTKFSIAITKPRTRNRTRACTTYKVHVPMSLARKEIRSSTDAPISPFETPFFSPNKEIPFIIPHSSSLLLPTIVFSATMLQLSFKVSFEQKAGRNRGRGQVGVCCMSHALKNFARRRSPL